MSEILGAIQDALSEVLDERVTSISAATDLQADLDLDSVMFVQFLLTLEDRIPGLVFDPDAVSQSAFNRLETLIAYIEGSGTAGAGSRRTLSPAALDVLYRKARNDDLGDALAAFGEAVSGSRGYLACNGFVVHDRDPRSAILGGDGTVMEREEVADCPDLVLNHLGLGVGRVAARPADGATASLAMLAVRLGLLSRILDRAYGHLRDRTSFGQRTLRHQLVKMTFAEVHGAVVRLSEQMRLRADRGFAVGLSEDHAVITEFNGKAEKLMGGHGYLLTGTHSLSYLSMLLFSIYAGGR